MTIYDHQLPLADELQHQKLHHYGDAATVYIIELKQQLRNIARDANAAREQAVADKQSALKAAVTGRRHQLREIEASWAFFD